MGRMVPATREVLFRRAVADAEERIGRVLEAVMVAFVANWAKVGQDVPGLNPDLGGGRTGLRDGAVGRLGTAGLTREAGLRRAVRRVPPRGDARGPGPRRCGGPGEGG